MNLHKLKVSINGKEEPFFLKDIVKFLSEIDAQFGKIEESGMENIIKDKIQIEENNNFWWSPLSADKVSEIMMNFRKNRL